MDLSCGLGRTRTPRCSQVASMCGSSVCESGCDRLPWRYWHSSLGRPRRMSCRISTNLLVRARDLTANGQNRAPNACPKVHILGFCKLSDSTGFVGQNSSDPMHIFNVFSGSWQSPEYSTAIFIRGWFQLPCLVPPHMCFDITLCAMHHIQKLVRNPLDTEERMCYYDDTCISFPFGLQAQSFLDRAG